MRAQAAGHGVSLALFEFVAFGVKQAWACLFGGAMLGLILLTFLYYPADAPLGRYDFLVIGAICLQAGLLLSGLETMEEARVILAFHIVGTVMEVFKTQAGSWVYPEASFLRIGDVPLFSGFMYAAVGSYIARVWRIFDFRFTRFPPLWIQAVLAIAIYINFFAHHYTLDIRNGLFIAVLLIYGRCIVWFRPDRTERPMPLVIGFGLVALFIWFAENIGTFAKAWAYPGQDAGWQMVSLQKIGAWYLLMIISFVLVAFIHKRGRSA
ncbi:MAG: DUF817 domain-containing protein [Hyphomonadaceae bacterium]